ncbi:MAG: uracil-DNA glycosylase family protein [Acidovorax sp.]
MALNLDARQRAMLQEMGISTIWLPAAPRAEPTEPAAVAAAPVPAPAVQAMQAVQTPAPPAQQPPPAPTAPASPALARPAYPQAESDGPVWLVVADCAQPDDPFAGDAGRLLDNMLSALRLHHNRRVLIAPLVKDAAGGSMAHTLAQARPDMVLALGLPAARAVLGSTEPLGRLRASLQAVDGTPVAVTYDPAYLLRAPQAKAAAWADLCHAAAIVAVQ